MKETITRQEFDEHCRQNRELALQFEKIMPLVDLIPTLNEIVEEKKSMTFVGKKILQVIGYFAAAIGLLLSILELAKRIK